MQLPSLEEFKNSLSENDLDYLAGLDTPDDNYSFSLNDHDDVVRLINLVMKHSALYSQRLLVLYHAWLAKVLANQS